MNRIKNVIYYEKFLLYGLVLFITIVFIIVRLPYFLHIGYPNLDSVDTVQYLDVAYSLLNFNAPHFGHIPIGYPLFITIIFKITNSLNAIIVIQNLITLFSTLLIIFTLKNINIKYSIVSGILMLFYIISDHSIQFDNMIMTDSLFSNLLIITSATFVLALKIQQKRYWILFSIMLCSCLLTRSSGVFTIIIWLLISGYFIFKKKYHIALSIILPYFIIILSYATYNIYSPNYQSFTIISKKPYNKKNVHYIDQMQLNNIVNLNSPNIAPIIDSLPKKSIPYILKHTKNLDSFNITFLPYLRYNIKIIKYNDSTYQLQSYNCNKTLNSNEIEILKKNNLDTIKEINIKCLDINKRRLSNLHYLFSNFKYTTYSPYESLMHKTPYYGWPIDLIYHFKYYNGFNVGDTISFPYNYYFRSIKNILQNDLSDILNTFYNTYFKQDSGNPTKLRETFGYKIYLKLNVLVNYNIIKTNFFILLFICGSLFVFIQSIIKFKNIPPILLVLSLIALIQFGSLSIYYYNNFIIPRYCYHTEFVYYLFNGLLIVYIYNFLKKQYLKKQIS